VEPSVNVARIGVGEGEDGGSDEDVEIFFLERFLVFGVGISNSDGGSDCKVAVDMVSSNAESLGEGNVVEEELKENPFLFAFLFDFLGDISMTSDSPGDGDVDRSNSSD
jgi:hypothetical protein